MLRTRIIPALLLRDNSLVKTVNFKNPKYIGDPANTCRIFNELEVDELCFLDIEVSQRGDEPNYSILSDIANECFMPLSYGGGIRSLKVAERIFKIGFEKIVINSAAYSNPTLISEISRTFGSQSLIVAIDVKRRWMRSSVLCSYGTKKSHVKSPVEWAKEVESLGAGEILLTSVSNEGLWNGFDLDLTKSVCEAVGIPVIAHGGAGNVEHIDSAIRVGASAVALGSMVVYQAQGLGVLVNFPNKEDLVKITG